MSAPDDPDLLKLVEQMETLCAAVRRRLSTEDPADDLLKLEDAAREFGRHIDTVRRWARDEALGEFIDGRWYIRRSLVRRYR